MLCFWRIARTAFLVGVVSGLLVASTAAAQPRWDDKLGLQAIERQLTCERVVENEDIASYLRSRNLPIDFINSVRLVTLESGLRAVFKPDEDRYAEVAAYRASLLLGKRLVPPTVFREIDRSPGSLQFFVEPDDSGERGMNDPPELSSAEPSEVSDANLFRFVFGQWDVGPTNHVIQTNGHKRNLALIDNSAIGNASLGRYGDFPFVARGYNDQVADNWDTPFPFDNPKTLLKPSIAKLKDDFRPFLPDDGIARLVKNIPRSITYVPAWRNQLWIQYYKDADALPSYTTNYNPGAVAAYQQLTEDNLTKIWAEALLTDDSRYKRLIRLTLERRDQVLQAAQGRLMESLDLQT